jgi:outer membrane protein assembly factor BamB
VAGTAALFWTVLTAGIPVASAAPADWPTYQFDNARTGFNSAETTITPANSPNLTVLWSLQAPGNPNAISVQPVVVNNTIYWGSWNGHEYATTFSGEKVSSQDLHDLGQTSGCSPPTVGVASTATLS